MLQIFVFLIVFCVGAFGASPSFFWRDAGEFILTALYRDISHQPGSPFYGSLASFTALIPAGPLAWRVNLFNVICGATFCALIANLIIHLAPNRRFLGFLALLCLFSAGFQRQLFTAEVYSLYAVISLILIRLAIKYYDSRDVRYIFAFTFLSGLGAGAHAAVVVAAGLLILCMSWRLSFRQFSTAVFFGLFGLLIFAYLPLRAEMNPPLNSGGISSVSDFINFVTNSRIGALRSESLDLAPSVGERAENFLLRLKQELGGLWGGFGLIGLAVWIYKRRRDGIIISLFAAANFIVFLSWDPDPWILGIGLLCVGVAGTFSLVRGFFAERLIVLGAFLFVGYFAPLSSLKNYYGAEEAGVLALGEAGSVELLEPGWFLGKSAAKLFNRDENVALFTPGLLFPEAFSNTKITLGGVYIDARQTKSSHPERSQFAVLSAIFKAASENNLASFGLQPTQLTNSALKNLLVLENGRAALKPGAPGRIAPDFGNDMIKLFVTYRGVLQSNPQLARADAQNYYESLVLGWSDLLSALGEEQASLDGLRAFCAEPYDGVCSPVSINNYALKLIDSGQTAAATKILASAIDGAGDRRPTIRHNLAFAVSKLKEELGDD